MGGVGDETGWTQQEVISLEQLRFDLGWIGLNIPPRPIVLHPDRKKSQKWMRSDGVLWKILFSDVACISAG